MYTLLIVDDEKWVRQGLSLSIDWRAEGIEVVGEAEDGEQALQRIEDRPPDILITDIRMPGLDGLELMEKLRERGLGTKVIVISGYSDFAYAQQALRHGASDYILKPIEEQNLLRSVRQCTQQLEKEREERVMLDRMSGRIRESLPLARLQYAQRLLVGDRSALDKWEPMRETLGVDLDAERVAVVAIEVTDWGGADEDAERARLRYLLSQLAQEREAGGAGRLACPTETEPFVDAALLVSPPACADAAADGPPLDRLLASVRDAAERTWGLQLNYGVSRARPLGELPASFAEAAEAAAHVLRFGAGRVFDAAEWPDAPPPNGGAAPLYDGPPGWDARLVHAVKSGNPRQFRELADELAAHGAESAGALPLRAIRIGMQRTLDRAEKQLRSCLKSKSDVRPLRFRFRLPAAPFGELSEALASSFARAHDAYGSQGSRKRIIEMALDYVKSHYAEGITMNDVAEHLYLNPSYFSKLFHEEMNETFSKYVTSVRMQEAKRLLKDSTLKIYEIASLVGYNDFRHFSKTFKELEGMTPAQYRDVGMS